MVYQMRLAKLVMMFFGVVFLVLGLLLFIFPISYPPLTATGSAAGFTLGVFDAPISVVFILVGATLCVFCAKWKTTEIKVELEVLTEREIRAHVPAGRFPRSLRQASEFKERDVWPLLDNLGGLPPGAILKISATRATVRDPRLD